ncbi:MAG: hypothetical protein WBM44_14450 [Waterburya sp.]
MKEVIKNFQQPIHDLEAWLASRTKAGQNRWEVYYQKYKRENKALKPKSESNSVSESIRQKAIAKHQEYLKQQKSRCEKIERSQGKEKDELESLLNNSDRQIKRINKLESQPQKISKPLGKYVSEGCEHLRNMRMKSFFDNESIQGGMA